jgi:hypothetical protein
LLVGGLLLSLPACSGKKGAQDNAIRVMADDWHDEFAANELASKQKYQDKLVEVTGFWDDPRVLGEGPGIVGGASNQSRRTAARNGDNGTRRVVRFSFARFFSRMSTVSPTKSTSERRERSISLRRAPVWAAKQNIG